MLKLLREIFNKKQQELGLIFIDWKIVLMMIIMCGKCKITEIFKSNLLDNIL